MKSKNIKIAGLISCVIMLGTLIPIAAASPQTQIPSDKEASARFPVAMIWGKLTDVRQIGKLVIAHAIRLHYIGRGIDMDRDHGVIRDRLVMFRDGPRYHAFHMGLMEMVFGHVQRLRIFI